MTSSSRQDIESSFALLLLGISAATGHHEPQMIRLLAQGPPAESAQWFEVEAIATHLFERYAPAPRRAFAQPTSASGYEAQVRAENAALDRILDVRERLMWSLARILESREAYDLLPPEAHPTLDRMVRLLERLSTSLPEPDAPQ